MSGPGKKKSSGCSGVDGCGVGNDQEDEIDELIERSSPVEGGERRGKRLSLFRISSAKAKLLLLQRKRKRRKEGNSVNSGLSGRCCLCINQSMTLESSAESPTSDPSSKEFTYDMMRVFIEKNDFYARECNPHLDDK